jgi:hypothetical protein
MKKTSIQEQPRLMTRLMTREESDAALEEWERQNAEMRRNPSVPVWVRMRKKDEETRNQV